MFDVIVTRDEARATALADRVASLGGRVTSLPVTRVDHEDLALVVAGYDAVVAASANAVPSVAAALHHADVPVFAVGAATAEAFAAHGLAAITPVRNDAIGVADAVLARAPKRVLWPRARDGRDDGIERLDRKSVV